ncbi:MAG: NAD(P)H-binding protein [Deltaproteobacteria bacterium]|nr:NAD(P)H-binding protein [Deltaproteobacteria bacterium]
MTNTTVLVLGATGGIGGEVARTLLARGWTIRALSRDAAAAARKEPRFQWRQGDALNAPDVLAAAQGASVIVHAVNPPGYRDWDKVVLPMLDSTIAAARAVGARIVFPGTVYNFGPDAFPTLTERSPQHPTTKKGAIRVEMERRLEAAGVPVIIVRCGDYFGPGAPSTWFSGGLIKPGKAVRAIQNPARGGIGHQWAYLPDVAETMVRLLERATELPRFAVYHMEGFYDADGTQMVSAIQRAVATRPPIKAFPWWIVPLLAPFVRFMRELLEMRYLWKQPLRMTNERLVATLGAEPHTPIDEAVKTTLVGLGCIAA